MYPEGQWSTDQSRSEVGAEHPCSRDELAQHSSKPGTSCGRVGLGLAGHGCLAPSSVLEHGTRAGGRRGVLTDLRSAQQLESEISLTEAAIAAPLAISPRLKMLDSGHIVTSVAQQAIPEIPSYATEGPSEVIFSPYRASSRID